MLRTESSELEITRSEASSSDNRRTTVPCFSWMVSRFQNRKTPSSSQNTAPISAAATDVMISQASLGSVYGIDVNRFLPISNSARYVDVRIARSGTNAGSWTAREE